MVINVIEALGRRHSVRAFQPGQVDKETLLKILEAANRAPSWADTQPWQLFVAAGDGLNRLREAFVRRYEEGVAGVTDVPRPEDWPAALKKRMEENYTRRFHSLGIDRDDHAAREANVRRGYEFWGAPTVVYLGLPREVTVWSYFDLGLFAQSLMLAAQGLGVGSIPAINLVTYPDLIRLELGIPDDVAVVIGIALGYEDMGNIANQFNSLRRPIEEVVRVNGI